jgi:hypothetical protein
LSTLATEVEETINGSGTTDELLFRELGDWVGLVFENSISASYGFGSGERPAWSTFSLVEDGRYVSSLGPVDVVSKRELSSSTDSLLGFIGWFESEIGVDEFFVGEIGELVEAVGNGLVGLWIFSFDEFFGLEENSHSHHFFFLSGIGFSVFFFPGKEFVEFFLGNVGNISLGKGIFRFEEDQSDAQ